MESITLRLENGAVFSFRGRLFSEAVWTDEDSEIFTHQKLYVTDQNEHVYVVRKGGAHRTCRAYRVSMRKERCIIYDGRNVMELPFDMLMLAMKTLCGTESGTALDQAEETLRSIGG
ncbi:MAG: hypothetical protein IJB29_04035 [Mailhella sp.]|nr:hypothetical protein [Mailhella sp.]